MKLFGIAIRLFLSLALVTGVAYPLLITLFARTFIKEKAEGSFLFVQGKPVGSALIAQKFQSDQYFWGRPSAVDYNPLPSGGSNLGPTSAILKKAVDERRALVAKAHGVDGSRVPPELLFASGSGLDPHISPATAVFQIERIVKARHLDSVNGKMTLDQLVKQKTEGRFLGYIGEPHVNVLSLNLALDNITEASKK